MMDICRHDNVSVDPILGGYCCIKCLEHFKRLPDALLAPPRAMGFWRRLKWAFTTRKKVVVVPFVWTVRWGNARQGRHPPLEQHWSPKQFAPKGPPLDKAHKLYTHPSNRGG